MKRSTVAVVVVVLAALVLATGAVLGLRQTTWWACHRATTLTSADPGYDLEDSGHQLSAYEPELIAQLPGVSGFLGGYVADVEIVATSGTSGEVVLSASPYFSEVDRDRDVSIDPASGEVSWNRGHGGQQRPVGLIGDHHVSVAAVDGGAYRVTSIDGESGAVSGCVDLERVDHGGIGRLRHAAVPDSEDMVVTFETNEGYRASRIDTATSDELWAAPVQVHADDLVQVGEVAVASRYAPYETLVPDTVRGAWASGHPVLLEGIDLGTGDSRWRWPAPDADPVVGSILGGVSSPEPLVVVTTITLPQDAALGTPGDHQVIALDARTGGVTWALDVPHAIRGSVVDDTVLYQDGEGVGALDGATGEERWRSVVPEDEPRPELHRAHAWQERTALVALSDGGIGVLDLDTGELAGATPPEGISYFRIYPTDEHLVLVTDDYAGNYPVLVFGREPDPTSTRG